MEKEKKVNDNFFNLFYKTHDISPKKDKEIQLKTLLRLMKILGAATILSCASIHLKELVDLNFISKFQMKNFLISGSIFGASILYLCQQFIESVKNIAKDLPSDLLRLKNKFRL